MIVKIYIATILFTYVCIVAMALDMSGYKRRHGWEQVGKYSLCERVGRAIILVLLGIIPIANVIIGFLVLANAKEETYERALRESGPHIKLTKKRKGEEE